MNRNFVVGDTVEWDTFEGVKRGTVTAKGSTWIEVDGYHVPSTRILCPAS